MFRFRYNYEGVKWVLDNYKLFSAGIFPDCERTECYGKRDLSAHAPFENACIIAAEVCTRIQCCGMDGLLVEDRYGVKDNNPKMEWEIAELRHIYIGEVYRRINNVIAFCASGRDRRIKLDGKPESYEEWKRNNKYTRQIRNGNSVARGLDKTRTKC